MSQLTRRIKKTLKVQLLTEKFTRDQIEYNVNK